MKPTASYSLYNMNWTTVVVDEVKVAIWVGILSNHLRRNWYKISCFNILTQDVFQNIPIANSPLLAAYKCDTHISSYVSRITSPNYPWPYAANDGCLYMIERAHPDMCYFQLEFNKFDLGRQSDHIDCARDHFQLPDGKRVCGATSGKSEYIII